MVLEAYSEQYCTSANVTMFLGFETNRNKVYGHSEEQIFVGFFSYYLVVEMSTKETAYLI